MAKKNGQKMHAGMVSKTYRGNTKATVEALLQALPLVSVLPWSDALKGDLKAPEGTQFTVVESVTDGSRLVGGMFAPTYQTVQHEPVISALLNEASARGLEAHVEAKLFAEGLQMAANISLPKERTDLGGFEAFTPSIIAFNSANGTNPVEYMGGGNIYVCDNGILWGNVHQSLARKHTVRRLADVGKSLEQMARATFDSLFEKIPEFSKIVGVANLKVIEKPRDFLQTYGIGPRIQEKIMERIPTHNNPDVRTNSVWGIVNGITAYARDLDKGAWAKDEEAASEPAPDQARRYRQIADVIMSAIKTP